jgi:hypothetical protein
MLSKIVVFFLLFMLVLGMFGKWRRKLLGRLTGMPRQNRVAQPEKCARCGKFLLGDARCDCNRG